MDITHVPVTGTPITYQIDAENIVILNNDPGDGVAAGSGSGSGPTPSSGGGGGITLFHNGQLTQLKPLSAAPVANFTYQILANRIVAFRNSSTNATIYLWSFGDGQTSTSANPYHQYAANGTYAVTLTVQGAGGTATKTVNVTVSTVVPVADFTYIQSALGVQFTNISTVSGTPSWNFGDGSTSSEANPYHLYSGAGTYTVILTIGNYTVSKPITLSPASAPGEWNGGTGSSGSGDGQFSLPQGITVDSNYIYVTDKFNHRVQVFNLVAPYAFVGKFGSNGAGDGQFSFPDRVTVDNTYLYIVDNGNSRVQIFNKSTYAFVGKFGSNGSGDGQLGNPIGIAVDNAYIYVVDNASGGRRVQIFNKSTYAFVGKFGSNGSGDGQFDNCKDVAVDDNYLYIIDRNNSRVQIFNKSTYAFVGKFGSYGAGDGQYFNTPDGIAVDNDSIYVADSGNDLVRIFNKATYGFRSKFGSSGCGDGQFGYLMALAVDTTSIYTIDMTCNRFQVFAKGQENLQAPPTASFTADVTQGPAPLTVQFTDHSTNTPTSWLWEFGDGTTSTAQNPSHIFTAGGIYPVKLTATNATGSGTYTMSIVVQEVVTTMDVISTSAFTPSAQLVVQGTPVTFTDASTGDIVSWLWNFGDGSTSTSQNPTHAYTNPGVYEVTLTATDATGMTTVSTQTIVVYAAGGDPDAADNPPTAVVAASATTGSAPLNVAFTTTPSVEVATYAWNFGDGSTSILQNPTHLYTNPGTYTATLTISNIYGSTTVSMTITVSGQMAAAFGPAYTYIVDRNNHRVLVFDSAGNPIGWFGGYGSSPGKLRLPTSLIVNNPKLG